MADDFEWTVKDIQELKSATITFLWTENKEEIEIKLDIVKDTTSTSSSTFNVISPNIKSYGNFVVNNKLKLDVEFTKTQRPNSVLHQPTKDNNYYRVVILSNDSGTRYNATQARGINVILLKNLKFIDNYNSKAAADLFVSQPLEHHNVVSKNKQQIIPRALIKEAVHYYGSIKGGNLNISAKSKVISAFSNIIRDIINVKYVITEMQRNKLSSMIEDVVVITEMQQNELSSMIEDVVVVITEIKSEFDSAYPSDQSKGGSQSNKILYKGYHYKIREEGRKKYIITKREGQVSLADAKRWLKSHQKKKHVR